MTTNEAKHSRVIVNEIEEWFKTEYPDIHVEHLRDCGTRLFFFKDPEHDSEEELIDGLTKELSDEIKRNIIRKIFAERKKKDEA